MTTEEGAALLSSLVKIPSLSRQEGPCVDALETYLQAQNRFDIQRIGHNLIARFGKGGPELWLNSHLDTVAAAEGYSFDPWSGEIIEGRVLGLGANDAKGSVAAMAMALSRFADLYPSFTGGTLALAATSEEEIGGEGLKRLLRDFPNPDAIIVGEPNEVRPANCCKGVVLAEIVVRGESAHVSRPWQGRSAVRLASPLIAELVADHGLAKDALLGPATHEITRIEGGHQSNALPASVTLGLDCRTTPTFDNDAMVAHLEEIVARHPDAELKIKARDVRPVRTDAHGKLVTATGQPEVVPFVGVCDFVYCGHLDAIIMGPGKGERSHKADEFLMVDELESAADAYLNTAIRYFAT